MFLISFASVAVAVKEAGNQASIILQIDSLNKLAANAFEKEPEFTRIYATRACTMASSIAYIGGEVEALDLLAKYYHRKLNYTRIIESYFRILDLYEDNQDIDNLVIWYARISNFFISVKDFDLAKKYLDIMMRYVQKSRNPSIWGQAYINQSRYYASVREYDRAMRTVYLSIVLFNQNNEIPLLSNAYKYIGDALNEKKMFYRAECAYRIAITFARKDSNLAEIAVLFTRIAQLYNVLNNNEQNLKYNLLAMKIREQTGPSKLISSSCLNVGEAYWLLGRKDSARIYLRKSLNIAENTRDTTQLEVIFSTLANFAKTEAKYADAIKYYMARVACKDKLSHEKNQAEILILEVKRSIRATEAQNEIIKREILIQKLQIRNRRIQIFLFEAAIILMLAIMLFIDAITRKNRKRNDELKELNHRLKLEISTRIEAEGRLKRSEELHRFLAENTVDVISLLDPGMKRLYISPSCEKFYGYNATEIMQMDSHLDLVEPSFHVMINQRILEMFRSKHPTRYVYKVVRKDGSTCWAEANINPILHPETKDVSNLITVVRDISERMTHEQKLTENARQKEYLLHEIHNRVKNNFAILISLMNMQRGQSVDSDLSGSLTDLQLRVRTMSLVHEQLYQTQEISLIPFDIYLDRLAQIISGSFKNNRIQLRTEIHPCQVPIEMALPLGLMINELITNAYKYAFPGERTGTIWVRLVAESKEHFSISISDDGIGLPHDFKMNSTQTTGSQIVGILIEQIEASLEVSGNDGACFLISFSTAQEK
jgi:PAS domain S-box-containing protein